TDVADYLAAKGVPFREAHAIVGKLVLTAIEQGTNLAGLPLSVYRALSDQFGEDIYERIRIENVVAARATRGGTAPSAVREQLAAAKQRLAASSSE
ncbi:MAG: argininosuccinate lyase, partial [Alicyclobacillus sp.]|nr:argininosuccinate lyase [Alicyclobacillus sp.]